MRNPQTPVASVVAFLPNITLRDLKDISRLKGLAPYRNKYILQEFGTARRCDGETSAQAPSLLD